MIEIKYDGKRIIIVHEGVEYDEKGIMNHVSENGHGRELASFAAPPTRYKDCKRISDAIEKIFREKQAFIKSRKIYY